MLHEKRELPQIAGAEARLKDVCLKQLWRLFPDGIRLEYLQQLHWELDSLHRTGTCSIFLIVSELLQVCGLKPSDVGYLGTLGGSLIAYLCGITCADPFNQWTRLYPEFCKGYDGDIEPDVELKIPSSYVKKAREKCSHLHGVGAAFRAGCVLEDGSMSPHPSAIMLVPEGHIISEYTEITSRDGVEFSAVDSHSLNTLYRLNLISTVYTDFIYELTRETGVNIQDIPLDDPEVYNLIHGEYRVVYDENCTSCQMLDAGGCSEFEASKARAMAVWFWPKNFGELVKLCGLMHATGDDDDNTCLTVLQKNIPKEDMIGCREDIFEYLMKQGIERRRAFEITEFVRKGRAASRKYHDVWSEIVNEMKANKVSDEFIDLSEHIRYLFPRAHAYQDALEVYWGVWFKINYREKFESLYLNIFTDK